MGSKALPKDSLPLLELKLAELAWILPLAVACAPVDKVLNLVMIRRSDTHPVVEELHGVSMRLLQVSLHLLCKALGGLLAWPTLHLLEDFPEEFLLGMEPHGLLSDRIEEIHTFSAIVFFDRPARWEGQGMHALGSCHHWTIFVDTCVNLHHIQEMLQ